MLNSCRALKRAFWPVCLNSRLLLTIWGCEELLSARCFPISSFLLHHILRNNKIALKGVNSQVSERLHVQSFNKMVAILSETLNGQKLARNLKGIDEELAADSESDIQP